MALWSTIFRAVWNEEAPCLANTYRHTGRCSVKFLKVPRSVLHRICSCCHKTYKIDTALGGLAYAMMSARNALAPIARALYRKSEVARPINKPAPSKGTLIILCGLPASGKTTHAQAIAEKSGAIHLDADEQMRALGLRYLDEVSRHQIEALQWTRAKELLAQGHTVIFESGPWARGERDVLRHQARDLGAAIELHYFTAPLGILFDRIRRRSPEGSEITREHLEEWSRKCRAPSSFEIALYDKSFWGGSGDPKLVGAPHPLTAYIATAIDVVLPVARRFKAMFGRRPHHDSASAPLPLPSAPQNGARTPMGTELDRARGIMPHHIGGRPLGLLGRAFWDLAGLLFLPLVLGLSLIFDDNKADPTDPE